MAWVYKGGAAGRISGGASFGIGIFAMFIMLFCPKFIFVGSFWGSAGTGNGAWFAPAAGVSATVVSGGVDTAGGGVTGVSGGSTDSGLAAGVGVVSGSVG